MNGVKLVETSGAPGTSLFRVWLPRNVPQSEWKPSSKAEFVWGGLRMKKDVMFIL